MTDYFTLKKTDPRTKARLGTLKTAHGTIESPFFMPVGTYGAVRGMSAEEMEQLNAQIMLSNTYHLFLRPGTDIIGQAGGLHKFINWKKPMLTDSGGYQVFSLAKFRKVKDDGVTFQSHIDGKRHHLTPEAVMDIERCLGSDMIMPLDECAPYPCKHRAAEAAVKRTTHWAARTKAHFDQQMAAENRQLLFGIIQGTTFKDLRIRSAEEITALDMHAFAIGGVSVGEPVIDMFNAVRWVAPLLPTAKPRYLMGIGLPDQIVKAVTEGIDMFDTVIPTRYGRHGTAFTSRGRMILLNSEHTADFSPLDANCQCWVCQTYTRAYLRHLFKAREMLGMRLVCYHNLYFYLNLMRRIREAIQTDHLTEFAHQFYQNYGSDIEAV